MLLWLEGGADAAAAVMASPAKIDALSNIIRAGQLGVHAVFGDRDFLNGMAESPGLGPGEAAFLRKKALELVQVSHALREFRRVRVSPFAGSVENSGDEWLVPLEVFRDAKVLGAPVIVGEHIRDAGFYKRAACELLANVLPSYLVRLTPVLGGGNTTSDVLNRYFYDGSPSWICIVDSDRKHSADTVGETARRCLAIHVPENDRWRFSLYVLSARAVENLLPSQLRAAALPGMALGNVQSDRLLNELPAHVSAYVSLKDGDTLCRFYLRGDLHPDFPAEEDVAFCSACGRVGGCEELVAFGRLFVRLTDSLDSGVARLPSPQEWCDELRSISVRVASFGLAGAPDRL